MALRTFTISGIAWRGFMAGLRGQPLPEPPAPAVPVAPPVVTVKEAKPPQPKIYRPGATVVILDAYRRARR